MKILFSSILSLFCGLYAVWGQSVPVQKVFDKPVFMHYMPWFETPEFNGYWGWHWTMNNQNPDAVVDGKRQIASHFYPLIGPYASIDPDVIEYHLLLMKYAGIDGLLIDWYGVSGSNGDINSLLANSNVIINKTEELGLEFALILEDRFSRNLSDMQTNLDYAYQHYFVRDNYFRIGQQNQPLVGIFGPIQFQTETDWDLLIPFAGEELTFLTIWNESNDAGHHADGEYAWIYETDGTNDHLDFLNAFYTNKGPVLNCVMGVAYPGFKDYYAEGNAGAGYFTIERNGNQTLDETLQLISQYSADVDILQLATWNDFGEGTVFEPTSEFGFSSLTTLQNYLGVNYGLQELQQIYRLYKLRKQFAQDPIKQEQLDEVFSSFSQLNTVVAKQKMDKLEGLATDIHTMNGILKVWYNDSRKELVIYNNAGSELDIKLYSIMGSLQVHERRKENVVQIRLPNLPPANYIVHIVNHKGEIFVTKFTIQ